MVENREIETENMKAVVKPISEKLAELIDKIQQSFEKKYGFKPSTVNTTAMIADALNKKSIHIL